MCRVVQHDLLAHSIMAGNTCSSLLVYRVPRAVTLSGGVNCCVQDARDACGIFFQPIAVHCLRRLGKLLTASCICTDQIIDHIPGMSNDCEHMHYAGKWLSRHKVNNVIIVPTGSVPCAAIESSSVRATKTRVAG